MDKHLIAISILMFAFVSGTTLVSAQQGFQDGINNQAPVTENRGQIGGNTEDRGGFDWRWLLPLLAVPIILMFRKDNKEVDRTRYQNQDYAGSKGGKSRNDRESDNESQ